MGGFSVVLTLLLLAVSVVLVKEDNVVSSVGPAIVEGAGEEDLVAVGVVAFVVRMVETADVIKEKKLLETGIDCDCGCGCCCCGSVVVAVVVIVVEVAADALVQILVFTAATAVGVAVEVVVVVVVAEAVVAVDSDLFLWWWVTDEKR
jgi:hypothetical protein